jgi:hypothetical protein
MTCSGTEEMVAIGGNKIVINTTRYQYVTVFDYKCGRFDSFNHPIVESSAGIPLRICDALLESMAVDFVNSRLYCFAKANNGGALLYHFPLGWFH